jgi:16S rRNA (adenine(1408)-N(1))-methyltransferase
MLEASRRAAGPARRGGVPNAAFIAAGVERLPSELAGIADLVTVRFPWGSLLSGALGEDAAVTAAIARLLAVGGRLELTTSLIERDRPTGSGRTDLDAADIESITCAFAAHGLKAVEVRMLTLAESAGLRSSWARRLRAGGPDRPVWRIAFVRRGSGPLG